MFSLINKKLVVSIIFMIVINPLTVSSKILFIENYNSIVDGWNCSDVIPDGWEGKSTCPAPETIGGVTHYAGEITSGGRTGNSFKLWRHNNGLTSYAGYLGNDFTEAEFSNHYKELYVMWYIKIDPDWDANLGSAESHKLNRFYVGPAHDKKVLEWYMNVNGATFKNGKFMFYNTGGGGVRYSKLTVSELGVNDGKWHSLEWHVKLNSITGSTDGLLEFWVDGEAVSICDGLGGNCTTQLAGDFGADTDEYFINALPPAIGNLTDGVWNFPTNGWYAIEFDDYVVSTTRIGDISAPKDFLHGN